MDPQRVDSQRGAAGQSAGDWLFKKQGQVFGPVSGAALVALLYKGEIDGTTPVSLEDGSWRPIGQVAGFLVHVKKAEAQLRVEAEVTGSRLLRRRRHRQRVAVAVVLTAAGLGLGSYGAFWLATEKPWQRRSALLEDFGGGIAIASPARIGATRRAADEEVELPAQGPGQVPRRPAAAPASRPVSGSATGGDLVVARYDPADIQAVVAREQRTLAPCFRAEAQRSPGFAGEVPVEFAIGNEGRVAQLWIDQPSLKHGELHDCLLRTLRTWSFRPFPGSRPTVSLTFRIASR
jgi:hypothetical protein